MKYLALVKTPSRHATALRIVLAVASLISMVLASGAGSQWY